MVTKKHTENYNGHFNAYVPEARVEVVQLDDIRHCIIFQHINESDSGVYVVRAINALGEAVCEAEIEVDFPILFASELIMFILCCCSNNIGANFRLSLGMVLMGQIFICQKNGDLAIDWIGLWTTNVQSFSLDTR